jgi:Raf kinase inhibitor-like YbhB/YbcL family protein
MAFDLSSTAFWPGRSIPQKYTRDGQNISPPLKWSAPPNGTHSLALICDDPDAPRRTFTHWVIFNLPADSYELAEGASTTKSLPRGATQGTNDFGDIGFVGPSPPPGKPHHYSFKLFALDQSLDLAPGATKDQLLAAMQGHILGETQLIGTFAR